MQFAVLVANSGEPRDSTQRAVEKHKVVLCVTANMSNGSVFNDRDSTRFELASLTVINSSSPDPIISVGGTFDVAVLRSLFWNNTGIVYADTGPYPAYGDILQCNVVHSMTGLPTGYHVGTLLADPLLTDILDHDDSPHPEAGIFVEMDPISISSVDSGPKITVRSESNPQRSASSGELSNHMSISSFVPARNRTLHLPSTKQASRQSQQAVPSALSGHSCWHSGSCPSTALAR